MIARRVWSGYRTYLVPPEKRVSFSLDVHDWEAVAVVQNPPAFHSHGHVGFSTLSQHICVVVVEDG